MSAHHGRYVAYYRVSTDRQGRTALGIDAQKQKVLDFLDGGRWELAASFVEVESGKRGDRPQLKAALAFCKKHKGTKLIVATLSRLTRDTRFLLTLIDGSVDVVFTDLPQVPPGAMGRFFLTMMAAVAEFEAGLTSERTKAALAQVKARGEKRLGNPTNLAEAQRKGAATMRTAAHKFALRILPIIREIQTQLGGGPTLRMIAAALNERGIPTVRGGEWHAVTVSNVLAHAIAGPETGPQEWQHQQGDALPPASR